LQFEEKRSVTTETHLRFRDTKSIVYAIEIWGEKVIATFISSFGRFLKKSEFISPSWNKYK